MDVTERGVGCPSCRQTFPTAAALARHEAMDHLPDPDGLALSRALDAGPGGAAPGALPEHLLAAVLVVLGTVAALTVLLVALSG